MCLLFIGVIFGMALMAFSGFIGIIGVYGVVVTLWQQCPEVLIGLGLIIAGVLYVSIGWSIFCKFADKLKDS